MSNNDDVLVVGGTGYLGGKVVDKILIMGKRVRVLARPGADTGALENRGVNVVRGDLHKRESLDIAVDGVRTIITAARNDSPNDEQGHYNLINAALKNGQPVFVFTSVLKCDEAKDVVSFQQKWRIELELEKSGLPFVIIRPGTFLDNLINQPNFRKPMEEGKFLAIGNIDVLLSYVAADDVATCLTKAAFEPRALSKRIDIAIEKPISQKELYQQTREVLGKELKLKHIPLTAFAAIMKAGALFSPNPSQILAMVRFYQSGKFVANNKLQRELFGPTNNLKDSLKKLFHETLIVS